MVTESEPGSTQPSASRTPSNARCVFHHATQTRDGVVDRGFTRAEREARVVQEARRATATTLSGIDVEEMPGHGDHLVLQSGAEQRVPRVDARRQVRQI